MNRPGLMNMVVCFLLGVFFNISCNDGHPEVEERPRDTINIGNALKQLDDSVNATLINVNPDVQYQVIDNFGASDCWLTQMVGNWPVSKKEAIADLLFSNDTLPNGQPEGIGLNAWRFNIGAGSAEQGMESQIDDEWRRAECFLDEDGSYDWNKQEGQQWFLKAARERGVEKLIGFVNSPPVHLTKNGLAHGSVSDPENITEDSLPDYAKFLVDVTVGLKNNTGVELTHLSPFNEPQWDWTSNSQEGCHMTNSLTKKLVFQLNNELETNASLDTRIIVSEAGQWEYLYSKGDLIGNQVDLFFGNENNPLKDAAYLEKIITGHSYNTTTPESALVGIRKLVWDKVSEYPGLEVWSTEYCPLGNGDLQQLGWQNWRKDTGMHVALYVARIIHHDLVYVHVSAWQWWLAFSNYNYPDGLIYVNGDATDGTYTVSKLMWTLGNYSRFIESGNKRISAICDEKEFLVTAFRDDLNKRLIIVLLNTSEKARATKFEFEGSSVRTLRPYITSDNKSHNLYPLLNISVDHTYEIPPGCAITFVGQLD